MYKLVLCLLPLFALSCKENKDGAFVVSGQFKNAPKGKITLQQLPYTGEAPIVLDSATLKENGSFTLRSAATGEAIYRIAVEQGPEVFFINDENRIKVRMDANDPMHPKFESSDASGELYAFINTYFAKDSAIRTFYFQADSTYRMSGNSDSVFRIIDQQGKQKLKDITDYITKVVRETESPSVAHFAIARGFQALPVEEAKALTNEALKRFKDHKGLTSLKTQIDAATAQQVPESGPKYPLMHQPAPDLTMNDPNGRPVSISQFKGKYVLVDFWASWCAPCRRENPNIVAAYNKYKSKNFTILGVSLDADKADWVKAIVDDNLTWPHMSDLKQWESSAVPAYRFEGIPFNVLLDPSGNIIASDLRGPELDKKLQQVLGQ